MSKAKVKVTVTPKKGSTSSLVAKMPVTITKNSHPTGKKFYQTKAQLNTHLYRGQRPSTLQIRKYY